MLIYPKSEVLHIYAGQYFTAEWYFDMEGKLPAFEYYQKLAQVDQERFDVMIRYLSDTRPGTILPKTLYRVEDHENKIYTLKPRDERF